MGTGKLRKEEINRKLLHLLALLIPGGIFYIPMIPGAPPQLARNILAFLLVASILMEQARQRIPAVQKFVWKAVGMMMRPEEKSKTTGSTWIFASGFLCTTLFPNAVTCIIITTFILGDAVAAIIGLSMGKTRIGKKSLEGSVACFMMCMVLFLGFFPLLPYLLDPWGGADPDNYGTGGLFRYHRAGTCADAIRPFRDQR